MCDMGLIGNTSRNKLTLSVCLSVLLNRYLSKGYQIVVTTAFSFVFLIEGRKSKHLKTVGIVLTHITIKVFIGT